MSVLVTGCAGFIGSHLTESLLEDGATVLGVDCFNDNYGRSSKLRNLHRAQEWDNFEFVPVDLARGDLEDLTADSEVIFHLAAEPGVPTSWGRRFETYLRNNVLATQQLLEAAKTAHGRRIVYASSSSVYGQAETLPTTEETQPSPSSPYGMTKLSAEHLCRMYEASDGLETVILRYFSVFGPRQRPDMAFSRFCTAALDGAPITLFGDGAQTRDFTYVDDVVRATRAAADQTAAAGRIFNIGGGSRASLTEAIEILGDLAGRPLEVRRQSAQPGDVRDTGAAIDAARELLGYSPRVELRDGLRAQWEWTLGQRSVAPR
jgi:UDP-glucuronate 4-epimerase